MKRTATAHIDLEALRHNYRLAKRIAPRSRIMAVIKADAYGHGLLRVAKALSDADALAVATLEEALRLRAAHIRQPVVVLQGLRQPTDLSLFFEYHLELVVHQQWHLDLLEQGSGSHALKVWAKIDTGMGRLGFEVNALPAVYDRLLANARVVKPFGVMTHMACADNPDDSSTQMQINTFRDATAGLTAICSLANSGAMMGWMESQGDWVRPGIMLYGVSPFKNKRGPDFGLRPVMTLKTRLIAVNHRHKGDTVGYGRTFECPEDMPIGIAGIGYGDGYPRHVSNGAPVLVNGRRAQVVGRVSMDSLAVDLRGFDNIGLGTEVTLWGEGLPVEEVAACADTVAYELVSAVACKV